MHISFDTGGIPAPSIPPLRIAVAGQFCSSTDATQPLTVDKNSFRDIIRACSGELLFEVPNHLGSHPEQLAVHIRITDLKSFTPEGLIEQVPELARSMELRDQLAALADGSLTYTDFGAGLDTFHDLHAFAEVLRLCQPDRQPGEPKPVTSQATPTPGPSQANVPGEDAIDRIMEMVDGCGENRTSPALSHLEQTLSTIVAGNKRPAASPVYSKAVKAAEGIIARQVDTILHHRQFQEYEALWRGLKFLVDRTDFREDIQIELYAIRREYFGDDVREHIKAREMAGDSDMPIGLLVIPFAIENHARDLEQLQLLGEAAGDLQVTVLISASPAFFQLASGDEASTMPYPGSLLSRPEYAKWNALRDKDASRWLTLCFNRFLLRAAYTPAQRMSRGLEEFISCHNDHLWGEPVWLLASLVTTSFTRSGWPGEITGTDYGQVEDLQLHSYSRPGQQDMQIPLESMLPGQLTEDLAGSGITAVICKANRDSAYLLQAPMLHRPEVYDDEAATTASRDMNKLPYQLLASRISNVISMNITRLRASSRSAEELGAAIGGLVQHLLGNTGPGAGIGVEIQKQIDESGHRQVDLTIHTGNRLLSGANLQLSFRV